MNQIQKLDSDVVNRISGSEIAFRPSQVVKELIENSLDANSSEIKISLKKGGVEQITVEDNGVGIRPDQFETIAKRFVTTKLQSYSDLKGLSSFGFRGEALSCLSYVATLTVSSRPADCPVAHFAVIEDGQVRQQRPVAGLKGTTISVSNLNRHDPHRRAIVRDALVERREVFDLIQTYATTFSGVVFSCTDGSTSFTTRSCSSSTPSKTCISKLEDGLSAWGANRGSVSSMRDVVSKLGGSGFVDCLLTVEANDREWHLRGLVSSFCEMKSSAGSGKMPNRFAVTVNGRFVNWPNFKKAISSLYKDAVTKDHNIWIHIDIKVPSDQVDPNADPTKTKFVTKYENELIKWIKSEIHKVLTAGNKIKSFAPLSTTSSNSKMKISVDEIIQSAHNEPSVFLSRLEYVGVINRKMDVCEHQELILIVDWSSFWKFLLSDRSSILSENKILRTVELRPVLKLCECLRECGLPIDFEIRKELVSFIESFEYSDFGWSVDHNDIILTHLPIINSNPDMLVWMTGLNCLLSNFEQLTDKSCRSLIAEMIEFSEDKDKDKDNDKDRTTLSSVYDDFKWIRDKKVFDFLQSEFLKEYHETKGRDKFEIKINFDSSQQNNKINKIENDDEVSSCILDIQILASLPQLLSVFERC